MKSFRPHTSRTVRYAFPALFTTVALLGAVALLSDDASYIRLEVSDTSVEKGKAFSIAVYAGASVPVNAVDIAVQYPKDQIEITGIDTGGSVITIWTTDPYVDDDVVVLRGGTYRNGFLGEHEVAIINAIALESGTAQFSAADITFLAGDGTGSSVPVEESNGDSLTVYTEGDSMDTDSLTLYVGSKDGEITGTASVGIATDIDGDGNVSMQDVTSFMSAWFTRDTYYDFNDDNKMNFKDFAIILSDSFYK